MPWFQKDINRFWLGEHIKLGLLIFIPNRSLRIVEDIEFKDIVALFVTTTQRWAYFNRTIVKKRFLSKVDFELKYSCELQEAMEAFSAAYDRALLVPIERYTFAEPKSTQAPSEEGVSTSDDYYPDNILSTGTRAYDPTTGEYNVPIYGIESYTS